MILLSSSTTEHDNEFSPFRSSSDRNSWTNQRKSDATMTNSRILRQVYLTTLVLLISSIQRNFFVNGQIGSLCACQPSTYTLTLDFGLTCDDKNTTGDGIIIPAACFTKGDGPEAVENEVPVSVQTIQIVELDQRLQVVNQTVEVGNFTDGSTLTYKSIIASKVDDLTSTTLPSGLQVLMTGTNAEGQSLVTTFIIRYTNNCSVYPVLVDTQVNGWVVFSELGPPPQSLCPLAPSAAPSPVSESDAPSPNSLTTSQPSSGNQTTVTSSAPTSITTSSPTSLTTSQPSSGNQPTVMSSAPTSIATSSPTAPSTSQPSSGNQPITASSEPTPTIPEKSDIPSLSPVAGTVAPSPVAIPPTAPDMEPTITPVVSSTSSPISNPTCAPISYSSDTPTSVNADNAGQMGKGKSSKKSKAGRGKGKSSKKGKGKGEKKKEIADYGGMDKLGKARRRLNTGNKPRPSVVDCPEETNNQNPAASPSYLDMPRPTNKVSLPDSSNRTDSEGNKMVSKENNELEKGGKGKKKSKKLMYEHKRQKSSKGSKKDKDSLSPQK